MAQRLYKYSEKVEVFDKTTNKMFPDDVIQKIQSYFKSSAPYKKARCFDCGKRFRYYPAHENKFRLERKNKKLYFMTYVHTCFEDAWCYYCTLQKQIYEYSMYTVNKSRTNNINIQREVRARKKYKKKTVESLFLTNSRLKYNGNCLLI